MAEERVQRKLAAILAADVVGYSRQMDADEEGTLVRLKTLRQELFDPRTALHGGRIFKTTGDGALVEFPSAADAVLCAVEVQQALSESNQGLPENQRIELRIGISLGDVIVEGDDLYGRGVNVAARLEGIAEPGGVCVSGNVHEHVRSAPEFEFEDLGEVEIKNITTPVRVYRVRTSSEEPAVPGTTSEPLPASEKPSIAVLPFENMSGDPEQEYFADGIAEDIITALSRLNQFKVISRNSSFVYKGQNVDVRQVARELGVRYVLEGSVRRGGDRLRITGQLIEASDGTHLWADRFDGDFEDVFELQDRITESVVGAIEPTLVTAEIERARRKPPESLVAYDLYLQALPCLYTMRPAENTKGLDLLHQAIDKDPNYVNALAYCAWGYEQRLTRGWEPHGDNDAETAIELARRALATNENDPHALAAVGFVLVMVARDYDSGLSAIRRAEELNPNVALVSMHIAVALLFAGESLDRTLTHMDHAIRVSPGDPSAYIFWSIAAFCHFFAGRDETAVEMARRSVDIYPDWDSTYWVLVPALVRVDLMEEARAALRKLRELSPHVTCSLLRQVLPYRDKKMLEMMVSGLSDAGLPE